MSVQSIAIYMLHYTTHFHHQTQSTGNRFSVELFKVAVFGRFEILLLGNINCLKYIYIIHPKCI